MSHFSVLVITENEPTDEILAAALQPFHEFECTGVDDQYVIDVDVTDKVEELWNETVEVVRFPSGRIANRFRNEFYTKDGVPDWDGKPKKEFELPAGCELAEVLRSELCEKEGETKEEYAKEYGGWELRDGRFWDRTNPNAKWDWWTVGGRYSGKFAPGYDPYEDPDHKETCWLCAGTGVRKDMKCENGCNGCSGTGRSTIWESKWKNIGNQIQVKDIPWDALRQANREKRMKWFHECTAKAKMNREEFTIAIQAKAEAHEKWMQLQEPKPRGSEYYDWLTANGYELLARASRANFDLPDLAKGQDVVAWVIAAQPVTCWAIVKDGVWTESGSMGWWGMSRDDKDPEEWQAEVNKLLESLPEDHWISCVDCHT